MTGKLFYWLSPANIAKIHGTASVGNPFCEIFPVLLRRMPVFYYFCGRKP
jgi:hypothetical protein